MLTEVKNLTKRVIEITKVMQLDLPKWEPPEEGRASEEQLVLPFSVVKNTRVYIEKIANQINGSYENGWYDACSVMIRRLIETLIIEVFEKHNIAHKIKNPQDNFLWLSDLIPKALNETLWNLGRKTKKALPKLAEIGNQSAHSRRFLAHRNDIKNLRNEIRIVVQELVLLADLK